MKVLSLEIKGKEYKAYITPNGYGQYEYMLFEIVPKKHWWSFREHYIGSGTIWENIEDEIFDRIAKEIEIENKIHCLAEQFDKL